MSKRRIVFIFFIPLLILFCLTAAIVAFLVAKHNFRKSGATIPSDEEIIRILDSGEKDWAHAVKAHCDKNLRPGLAPEETDELFAEIACDIETTNPGPLWTMREYVISDYYVAPCSVICYFHCGALCNVVFFAGPGGDFMETYNFGNDEFVHPTMRRLR